MNQYYVYQYVRDDGSPYYIGKGKGNRAYSKHASRKDTPDFRPKNVDKIIILFDNLPEEEAFEIEKKLITHYGIKMHGGILINLTLGGEGCSGYKHSQETLEKLSKYLCENHKFKNKSYEDIYGEHADMQKEKRRNTVIKYWENIDLENKKLRIKNMKSTLIEKSKYDISEIELIKQLYMNGKRVVDIHKDFPHFNKYYLYDLCKGRKRND